MGFVWCRVIVKLCSFAFLAGFVFLFVVHGYRYDSIDQSLKQMNSYIQIQFWSGKHKVKIYDKEYKSSDNKINIYHLESGCYQINIHDSMKSYCIQENNATYISYVKVKDIIQYPENHLACLSLDTRSFSERCIKDTCFSEPITNAFIFSEIHFVKTKNKLWYCAKDFKNCNHLYDTDKEIICGIDEGLVFSDATILRLE